MTTMIGTTTRDVTFSNGSGAARTFPKGTKVYATIRKGGLRIRIPWTLWEQDVNGASVEPS